MGVVAVALVATVAIVALAFDIGFLYSTRRRMQTAADAAAVAGANALQGSNSANYSTAATDVASFNGYTNGSNSVTVTVPAVTTCPGASTQRCVQVTIQQAVPTSFLGVIGYSTVNVSVTAIAGSLNGPACIYALDPSASKAISLVGNVNINVSCGLIDDSDSSSALYADGNITVTSTATGVAGQVSQAGNISFTPPVIPNIAPAPDPLGSLAPPTVGTCTQAATTAGSALTIGGVNNTPINVPPGVYPVSGSTGYGINLSGNFSSAVNFAPGTPGSSVTYGNGIYITGNVSGPNAAVNFQPGQYQNGGGSGNSIFINGNTKIANFASGSYTFCGGVTLTGNSTVTFQPGLYYGGIAITGNANVTFSPGTYILAGGGLQVTGNATITGSGVTFYNTTGLGGYGAIRITGNAQLNLSAPTSGSLEGILFFQDRSIPTGSAGSVIVGNSSSTFDGALYFPTTSLQYVGNSSGNGYTLIVADTVSFTGNASLGDNYSSLTNGDPIVSNALYQ
ncbi:MAG TPA: pilus assembly protein TadG-related protein [Candidatus Binataceae bacterium]|nr:pilus assembly protein TadG-related protein [Candidatus Binataceae bacterium]